jgi:hypothetical protein
MVQIGGASADRSVRVEAHAHVGLPLTGQSRKLTTDTVKPVGAGARLGTKRLVMAVADSDAEAYLCCARELG